MWCCARRTNLCLTCIEVLLRDLERNASCATCNARVRILYADVSVCQFVAKMLGRAVRAAHTKVAVALCT